MKYLRCPSLSNLPAPPPEKSGWPWTEEPDILPLVMPNGKLWPRVSLVVPSFNQGRFIEETLRGILLQGYSNLECIVIDGGSTDETLDVIRKYEAWLFSWKSEPDRGQSHAINKGIEICSGKYFNWNNADDVLTKNSLKECVLALETNQNAGSVTGYTLTIDEFSNVLSCNDNHPILKGSKGFLHNVQDCITHLKCGCQPGGLMNLDLVKQVGGIDETIHYSMDNDLQLRMMIHRPCYHIDYPVIMFRKHPTSKTCSYVGDRATERIKIAKKIFSNKSSLPHYLSNVKSNAFYSAYKQAYVMSKDHRKYLYSFWYFIVMAFFSIKSFFKH